MPCANDLRRILPTLVSPQQASGHHLAQLQSLLCSWISKFQTLADERGGQAYALALAAPHRYERLIHVLSFAERLRNDEQLAEALLHASRILLQGPLYEAVLADTRHLRCYPCVCMPLHGGWGLWCMVTCP